MRRSSVIALGNSAVSAAEPSTSRVATARSPTAEPPVLAPGSNVLMLSPDEADFLSHFFYRNVPSGRVESEDELDELLIRAQIRVPPVLLPLFSDRFGGADGVVCEEFLDICRIVKTMHIILISDAQRKLFHGDRQTATTSGIKGNDEDHDDDETQELHSLFERLRTDSSCAEATDDAQQQPQHSGGVPASALEIIRSRRYALERLAATRSYSNTPRGAPHDDNGSGDLSLPLLKEYDEALSRAEAYTAQAGECLSAPHAPNSSVTAEEGRTGNGIYGSPGIATRPNLDDVLLQALVLAANVHSAAPMGTVAHVTIKRELSEFGLLDVGWNATRSLESLGCLQDEKDDPAPPELFVDTTLYVPLDIKRFCSLLRSHGRKGKRPSPPRQGIDRDETHDDLIDIDVDDSMDGVENIVRLLHARESTDYRRMRGTKQKNVWGDEHQHQHNPEDDGDSENFDDGYGGRDRMHGPTITYVEDPLTGELVMEATANRSDEGELQQPEDVAALAALENSLFVSPSRQRRLNDVRDFLMAHPGAARVAKTPPPSMVPVPLHSRQSSPGRRTPPPGGPSSFHPDIVPPPALGVRRAAEDDEHNTGSITPEDSLVCTARRQTLHSSRTGKGGGPSHVGGVDMAHSTSSATGTLSSHRVHPLHHKLRQIILHRLHRVRDHLAHHPFPISRKAQVHSGLTPTTLPLPRPSSTLDVGGGGVFALENSTFLLNKSSANVSALRQTSEEGKMQRAALDGAFPSCDMSYADFFFVPQLGRVPKGGVPLHVAHQSSQHCAATKVPSIPVGAQVVPGLYSDVPAPQEDRYRTTTNATNSDLALHHHHTHHEKRQLHHSYLSPGALAVARRRQTSVDGADWVSRLSPPKRYRTASRQEGRKNETRRQFRTTKTFHLDRSAATSLTRSGSAFDSVQRALGRALADVS